MTAALSAQAALVAAFFMAGCASAPAGTPHTVALTDEQAELCADSGCLLAPRSRVETEIVDAYARGLQEGERRAASECINHVAERL